MISEDDDIAGKILYDKRDGHLYIMSTKTTGVTIFKSGKQKSFTIFSASSRKYSVIIGDMHDLRDLIEERMNKS